MDKPQGQTDHTPHEWSEDILGPGYEYITLPLHPDEEGEVVTTLIRHVPSEDPHALPLVDEHSRPAPSAFLAIHGWNDYFYQKELARHISALGAHFYALDLRKYGRSHREGQTWGFITRLSDYDADIHVALDAIYREHGSDIPVILYGHSTGGLTTALWADRHPGAIAGLVLNSPWLDLQGSTAMRRATLSAVEAAAKLNPSTVIPVPDSGFYQRTLTGQHTRSADLPSDAASDPFYTTGWEPHPAFRNSENFPVRIGWFRAVIEGHKQVAKGLSIPCPILMLTSARSVVSAQWSDHFLAADSVLTVENLWRRAPFLGSKITLTKLDGAVHDVVFSRRSVREAAFAEISQFLVNTLGGESTSGLPAL